MKRLLRNLPIKHKLMALTVGISGVALLLACAVFAIYEQGVSRRTMARDFAILANMFDDNVAPGLAFNDPGAIEKTLATLIANPRIVAACVYDTHGAVIGAYRRPGAAVGGVFNFPAAEPTSQRFGAERLDTFQDITLAGEVIGGVYIGAELGELRESAWRYAAIVGLLLIGCSLVALVLAARLQRIISQPIEELAHIVATIAASKDYAVRAHQQGHDELGRLIAGFNEMLVQIQARDAALQAAQHDLEQRVDRRTEELRSKTALLEAQQNSSIDGILVVGNDGKKIFQNQRTVELLKLPPPVGAENNDEQQIQFVASRMTRPEQFLEKVRYLNSRSDESSRDEIEFKDGTVLDRTSAPVIGKDGRNYGRIWGFRDITERKQAEAALQESETRFRVIFNKSPLGIALVDLVGRPILTNTACQKMMGRTAEELRGMVFTEFTHPEDRDKDMNLYRQLVAGERDSYQIDKRFVRKDSQLVWTSLSVTLVRGPADQPQCALAMVEDITERRQAENALRESNEKFHQLADNITDAFWIRSPDMREVQYVSPAFERIWGRSVESLYANPQQWSEFILPEDRERVLGAFAALTGDAASLDIEYRIVRPDGEVRWIRVRGFQVRDVTDKLIRHIGVVTDITERKQSEAELATAHRKLLENSRQAGMAEIATSVLHNVGNVLNSVNVSATLVADQVRRSEAGKIVKVAALFEEHRADLARFLTDDPRGQIIPGYLGALAESVATEQKTLVAELEHLRKNVEHIKGIVAMQQSHARKVQAVETVSMTEMVEDALRITAESLARHGVQINRDYQSSAEVSTDRHKVLQILINLVRNAKFACVESGRTDRQITVRTTSAGLRVQIAVIDNGVGISAENLDRIFGHGFTTRKDGHGFGLHSGALAAKQLGGSLSPRSDGPGRGATFTLELPVRSPTATPFTP